MASAYPGAVDTFTANTDDVDDVIAADVNELQEGVVATQTELGTDPAGSCTDVKTRLAHSINDAGFLEFDTATELTISGGAITRTQNFHIVDTESDDPSDELDTISGASAGLFIVFRIAADARNVVIKHNTGNIYCASGVDITLDLTSEFALGVYDNDLTKWLITKSAKDFADIVDTNGTSVVVNEGSNDVDFRVETNGQTHAIFSDGGNDRVGIFTSTLAAALDVTQPGSAAAIPVLELDQDDVDDAFINFVGTSAADQTKSISTVNGDGSVEGPKNFSASAGWAFAGMVRCEINGTVGWMPYYTADTS